MFSLIVGDLDAALRSIKPDLPPLHEFGSDNPHMATVYAPDEIQPVIIFNLAALREFGKSLKISSNTRKRLFLPGNQ